MAISSTVHRVELNVADMDRHYYADHALTVARHPSETDERMMMRILAFGLHAHERLEFGRGLAADDEPDLWRRDLTGKIELWIDVGQPEERWVRKGLGRSDQVVVYAFGGRTIDPWWARVGHDLARCRNLAVIAVPASTSERLAALANRTMELQLMIQDGEAWMACGDERIVVERQWLLGSPPLPQ
jgi:uncharacterized protein YaeQ